MTYREIRRNPDTFSHHHLFAVSYDRAGQALGNAVVGRCSKQDESHQGVRLPGHCIWVGLHRYAVILTSMKALILLTAALLLSCSRPGKEAVSDDAPGALPAFMITLTTGEQLMSNTLSGNLILIFYNPECDHCEREAEDIRKNLGLFENYSLYFIAASPLDVISEFARKYDLVGHSNVKFARAEIPDVMREMGPLGTPSLFIYSKEKQLVKKFDGETPVEEIAKFL